MLYPSRHIDTAELHEGAMFSTLLDLLAAIAIYVKLRKKIKGTKSGILLDVRAKCAAAELMYINMHFSRTLRIDSY